MAAWQERDLAHAPAATYILFLAMHLGAGSSPGTLVGAVLVDPASGDVLHGLGTDAAGAQAESASAGSGGQRSCAVESLEALLLSRSPVEVVAVGDVSTAVRRLVVNYLSSAAPQGAQAKRARSVQPAASSAHARMDTIPLPAPEPHVEGGRVRAGRGRGAAAAPAPSGTDRPEVQAAVASELKHFFTGAQVCA